MTQPAKHTPGPWQAVQDKKRNAYAWNVIGAPGVVPEICRLTLIDAGAQIEANAHLIAAAPAMYEALKLALAWSMDGTPDSELSPIELGMRQAVEAALTQAEGKQ